MNTQNFKDIFKIMKSKLLTYGILIFVVIGLIFVSGCVQKEQQEKYSEQLGLDLSIPYNVFNYTLKAVKTQNMALIQQLISKEDKTMLEENTSYYNYFIKQFPKIKERFYFNGKELPVTIHYNESGMLTEDIPMQEIVPVFVVAYTLPYDKVSPYGIHGILFLKEGNQWKLNLTSFLVVYRGTNYRKFMWNCYTLCENMDTLDYCTYYFESRDLDFDGIKNELIKDNWPACESRVYCFLYTPCRKMGLTSIDALKKCSKLLCDNYLEKYDDDTTLASKAVLKEIIESDNSNECNLASIPEEDNWHKRFFPENVCEK